jgi:hypothetical protein
MMQKPPLLVVRVAPQLVSACGGVHSREEYWRNVHFLAFAAETLPFAPAYGTILIQRYAKTITKRNVCGGYDRPYS